jgi:mono/diheme cytochrome c family protein
MALEKFWRVGLVAVALGMLLALPPVAAAAETVDTPPTFTKDIAAIFQQKCEACHRPGYIAPMSLVTYQEVRPWARSIK